MFTTCLPTRLLTFTTVRVNCQFDFLIFISNTVINCYSRDCYPMTRYTTVSSSGGDMWQMSLALFYIVLPRDSMYFIPIISSHFYKSDPRRWSWAAILSSQSGRSVGLSPYWLRESDPRRWYLSAFYSANQDDPLALSLLASSRIQGGFF